MTQLNVHWSIISLKLNPKNVIYFKDEHERKHKFNEASLNWNEMNESPFTRAAA